MLDYLRIYANILTETWTFFAYVRRNSEMSSFKMASSNIIIVSITNLLCSKLKMLVLFTINGMSEAQLMECQRRN